MPDVSGEPWRAVRQLDQSLARASRRSPPRAAHRREFWAKNYAAVKAANAKLPILLRESEGTVARLTGNYGTRSAHPPPPPPPPE